MTTSANTPRLNYVADGSSTAYTFNFEIADQNSIAVYVGTTLKTLTTDYTVAFDSGTSGTGTVTLTTAPSNGTGIYLIRDTDNVRATDFEDSGAFLASTVNAELDRLTQGIQDLENTLKNRVLASAEPNDESSSTLTFGSAADRANKAMSFDASGNLVVSTAGTGTVTSVATGTGLTGGPVTTTGTISIDSTVATLTGTQTLTNKTIDADNNTVSNIEVDNLKSGVLDTDLSSVSASDDTLASAKAIKTYIDAQNTAQAITFVGDDSTGTAVNTGETFKVAGAGGVTTAVSGDTLTITGPTGTLSNVVEDTTPQLGGDLDVNGQSIVSVSNGDITLDANGTGRILLSPGTNGVQVTTGNLSVNVGYLESEGVRIEDNKISTYRSNDNLILDPAGTGKIQFNGNLTGSAGTITADSIINAGSYAVKSSHTPAAGADLINKDYLDGQGFLTSVGGTISDGNSDVTVADSGTGSITVTADGNTVSTFTDAAGLTMSKNIAMGGNTITGLSTATPSADSDVAHKKYVDDSVSAAFQTSVPTLQTGTTTVTTGSPGPSDTIEMKVTGNTEMTITDDGVRVHGNLTVDGTQTILNTSTLSVEDNIITVNRNISTVGAMPTNSGLEINRGDVTAATLYWNETDDRWDISGTVSTAIRTASITDQGSGIEFNNKTLRDIGNILSNGLSAQSGQKLYIGLQNNLAEALRIVNSSGQNIITIDAGSGTNGDTINFEGNINTSYTASRPFTFSNTLTASGTANFTGTVNIDNLNIFDNKITSDSNADIILDPGGTGEIAMGTDVRISDNTQDHFIGNIKNDGGNSLQLSTVGGGGIDLAPSGSGVTVFSYLQTSGDDSHIQTESIRIDAGSGLISGRRSNEDISIQPAGTGNVILGAIKIDGTTISSDDSTQITIAENIQTTGSLDTNAITGTTIDASTDVTTPRIETASGDLVIYPGSGGSTTIENVNGTVNLGNSGTFSIFSSSRHNFSDKAVWNGNLEINDNYIKTTASNSDLELSASGTGTVTVNGLAFPTADGTNGQVLTTDGAGNLSFTTVAGGSTDPITFVGDDSTGTAVNTGETFKIAGGTNITTAVSGDTLTITGPDLSSYLTAETNDLSSAVTWANVPDANITQSSVTQHQAALSITESQISDLGSYLTAETNDLTSAVTWANVPDANITQSSVTQHQAALSITESQISDLGAYITDANITIVGDDSTGITFSAKNNDDIKITGTGGITSTVSGNTITIDGSGVSGGGASTGDFTFSGNTMTTSSSNADAEIEASGTGNIVLQKGNAKGNLFTQTRFKGVINYGEDLTHTAGSDRFVGVANGTNIKLDGTDSSSSNARFYNDNQVKLDLNGASLTASSTYLSRGPRNLNQTFVTNSHATDAADIMNASAVQSYFDINDTYLSTSSLTIDSAAAGVFTNTIRNSGTSGVDTTINNYYGVYSLAAQTSNESNPGTLSITNDTGFYHYVNTYARDNSAQQPTNTYAFVTNYDKARSKLGALEKFNEYAYEATHSSGAGYTIDFNNGNLQAVTLTSNITSFTMSNFPTNSKHSAGITLYLIQDGTGSRTVTFSAGSGETFKFASGASTSSVTGANDIQVVYIFSRYNGSSNTYYWTIGPAYS